jgi:hypothetical protein
MKIQSITRFPTGTKVASAAAMSKRGLDLAFGNLGAPKRPVRTSMMSARRRIPKS